MRGRLCGDRLCPDYGVPPMAAGRRPSIPGSFQRGADLLPRLAVEPDCDVATKIHAYNSQHGSRLPLFGQVAVGVVEETIGANAKMAQVTINETVCVVAVSAERRAASITRLPRKMGLCTNAAAFVCAVEFDLCVESIIRAALVATRAQAR